MKRSVRLALAGPVFVAILATAGSLVTQRTPVGLTVANLSRLRDQDITAALAAGLAWGTWSVPAIWALYLLWAFVMKTPDNPPLRR